MGNRGEGRKQKKKTNVDWKPFNGGFTRRHRDIPRNNQGKKSRKGR